MKKLFYILIIAFTTSVTVMSCTEENVEPQSTTNTGGGGVSEPNH